MTEYISRGPQRQCCGVSTKQGQVETSLRKETVGQTRGGYEEEGLVLERKDQATYWGKYFRVLETTGLKDMVGLFPG